MHCLSFQLKQLMANKPLLGLGITHWSKPVFGRVKSESITIWPEPNYSSVRKALFILASKPINLQATARSIGVCLCACACACVYLISQGPRVKYDLNTYCTWRQNGDSQQRLYALQPQLLGQQKQIRGVRVWSSQDAGTLCGRCQDMLAKRAITLKLFLLSLWPSTQIARRHGEWLSCYFKPKPLPF